MKRNSIGKDKAIELANSKWWENLSAEKIFLFQMGTQELCMPFDKFHEATEKALNRPVWTHEFAYSDKLMEEFKGERNTPTFEEICNLIPKNKRIVINI